MATSQPSSSTAAPDSSLPNTTDEQCHKPSPVSAQPSSSSPAATGCLASVQRCQARTEAFNARLEAREAQRKRRKKEGSVVDDEGKEPGFGGDPTWIRKGMVPAVFVIMWWVYSVFVARLCVPAIQRTDQALASRATGVGLLVAATLLVLMTQWTYLRVLATAPGYVRDHVGVSDCPPEEEDEYYGRPPPGAAWGVQAQQQQQAPYPQPWDPDAVDAQLQQPEPNEQGDELPVDPSLPAIVGPLATAAIANADVEAPPASNNTQPAPPPQQAQQQHFLPAQPNAPRPLIPKPARLPPSKPVLAQGNRYCFRCQRVKPPRAHHCRRCGTCVLRMDHHCPWVGGCVGARNHKFFFHFVTWTTIYELFLLISSAVLFQRGVKGGPGYEAWRVDGFVISLFVLCSIFTLFTGALFTTHLYLLTHNMTTIEHLSFDRQKRSEEALLSAYFSNAGQGGPGIKIKERRRVRKEWDEAWGRMKKEGNLWWRDGREKGTSAERANWSAVMGEKWWMWIVPLGHSESDGLHYPPNPRFSARGVQRPRSMWPPELQ